jgi:hypothetical protein
MPPLLENQDRSLWNQEQIAEGVALLEMALSSHRFGSYTAPATQHPRIGPVENPSHFHGGNTDSNRVGAPNAPLFYIPSSPALIQQFPVEGDLNLKTFPPDVLGEVYFATQINRGG